VWFDTPRNMAGERAARFTQIVRTLQPKTLIDGRLGESGDYVSTGDNVIPTEKKTEAWEVPATLNHTWGYRADDHDWKSVGDVVFKLVDVVSKGGNYLLNVGPMANGEMPAEAVYILKHSGEWLTMNGEAVYGAGPSPFGDELGEASAKGTKDLRGQPLVLSHNEYRYTTKPGKLFITFFNGPRVPFALPKMQNAVTRAYRLSDKTPIDIKDVSGDKQLQLQSFGVINDPMATVIVVEFEGDSIRR
jgi:alpha-L-fucosidase